MGIWFFGLLNLWVGEAVTVSQISVLRGLLSQGPCRVYVRMSGGVEAKQGT